MIISHKHKFIFIHSNKCAGTSIVISLASVCGDDDIIGPVTLESLSDDYKHPENYDKNKFEDTMSAKEIKDNIPLECWNNYFKFSVVRNPWDRMVSAYHWQTRNGFRPFDNFLTSEPLKPISISKQLKVDGKLCIDYLIRYENLNEDYKKVCNILKIESIELPQAKSGFRDNRIKYFDYYNDITKEIINEKYKDDIENFNYKFGE